MSRLFNFSRAALLLLAMTGPALAEETPDIDAIVATVNGEEITLGELIALRSALPQQYQSLPADVLFKGILEQVIQQTALAQSLQGEAPRRVEIALVNERRSLLSAEVLDKMLSETITEADIRAAYDEKFAEYEGDVEFNASHILVETEEEALAILAELEAGADFAEMAKAKSTGPSGPSGGSLGWFGLGQMVKPFEDAVVGMSVGEISKPVKTQFGWHVIILNDSRRAEAPAFDDVRVDILSELQNNAVDAFITDLTSKATIDDSGSKVFDPSVIMRNDLLAPAPTKE